MDPYRDSIEHLTDELKRVDLLIRRALTIARDRPPHGNEEYRGLLISEPEIDELLERDDISKLDKEAILATNAKRFYGIEK